MKRAAIPYAGLMTLALVLLVVGIWKDIPVLVLLALILSIAGPMVFALRVGRG